MNISGGGFGKTFKGAEDYTAGQLNLKPATRYTFNLTIFDTAGVKKLQLQLPTLLNIGTVTGIPEASESLTALQNIYTIDGSASNPYTSFIIYGEFTTWDLPQGQDVSLDIRSNGTDYTPNSVSINIPCYISQTPSGGYGWVTF